MKRIGVYLKNKKKGKTAIDDQTVFYLFKKIMEEEYGKKGKNNVVPDFFKNEKLFVKCQNSNWKNEIWLNKEDLVKKLNKEIGGQEIKEIKIK